MDTNNNKKIWDTPIWIPTNQLRVANNTLASMTTAKNTNDRYTYHLQGALFFRYDTQKDVFKKLASPNIVPLVGSSIKYSADEGYRGNVLGATSNTVEVAPLYSDLFVGKKIKVTSGYGYGQERTVLSASDPTIHESGVVTTATANALTDTTKRWEINQYIGYQVRVVYGTGTSQVRKVLYNDANTLYFFDANYQQLEAWNNNPFSAVAPYAVPVATAGLQANYFIESAILTLDSNWGIIPDDSSSYVVKGGGVFCMSSIATAPWSSFQYYDVLSDTWTTKTPLGGTLLAGLGTDFAIECITEETPFETGTATGGTARTLIDTTKTMAVDRYKNFAIKIISGAGTGQENRIVANGTNYFEIARPFEVQPDATTVYEIHGEINRIYLVGNGASSMYQYSVEYDQWFTGQVIDYGQTRNMTVQFAGQEAYAMNSGVRSTSGITVLNPVPTAKGFGYAVGDLFNITTGGTVGKGRVETISAGGVVETVSLYSAGTGYTTGAGKATTNISGTGTGLTVNITTIGTVARVTLATNSNLYKGDQITIKGCTDGAWNTTYTVLAIDSLTTFDIAITAGASAVTASTNSTVLVVDGTKNWAVNEHVGKLVSITTAGTSPTTQIRRITANTATTLTVATIVAGVNGTSRYNICHPEAFGKATQYNKISENGVGVATGGTTTTLVDSTKNWIPSQWAMYKVRITAGTGVGQEVFIVDNTANTLQAVAFGFTPDSTTRYQMMDTYGMVSGAGGISTIATAPTAGGTGYAVGDILAITGGSAQAKVTAVNGGVVTALMLVNGGISGYSVVAGVATTNVIGTGSGCTVNVTAITAVASTTVFFDNTKNWPVNKWAGKRVVFTSGLGQRNEYSIISNTNNSITTAVGVAPDATSTYTILEIAPRSTGTCIRWIYGSSDTAQRGNFIFNPRGGGTNTIDIYDITKDSWKISPFYSPQSETMIAGSSYCYDGEDKFLYTVAIAGDFIYVHALDVNTLQAECGFQTQELAGTAHIGNLMEVVKSPDGGKFLFMGICTSRIMLKTLIY